ncbi:hypothetical protein Enr10x_31890 [Gimesia panareensis]|uniref:DUF4194 domain-containing protein n=1 Tax=Gimesia panareensis TaxID=2527978 RepID=A0A517Q898_9PLAN|nr:DUF4194 domain-containing protein [Gimesia panareensis]QDT27854.1 hypothetical protein Enr10x_31890 [Gimesia panareensis]
MSNIFDRKVSGSNVGEHSVHQESTSQTANIQVEENSSLTSSDVKELTQELLKNGYIEETRKPEFFRRSVIYEKEIIAALEPLDLILRLDTHRGVAFLAVAESACNLDDGQEWTHPLVRRQRLTLEQSLLVAILRQAFVMHEQESGVGYSTAKISIDDLLPQFLTYFDDSGSDAKNESRLMRLLDQLKIYGIVSEVDKNQEVIIRPLIAHLANPESLSALLQILCEHSQSVDCSESDV